MVMSSADRHFILRKEWDVSQRDIASAVRQTIKIKNQRRQTIIMDSDVFWIRIEKSKQAVEGFMSKMRRSKKSDHGMDDVSLLSSSFQRDYMDVASDHSQAESLDCTSHRNAILDIEPEEGDGQGHENSTAIEMLGQGENPSLSL